MEEPTLHGGGRCLGWMVGIRSSATLPPPFSFLEGHQPPPFKKKVLPFARKVSGDFQASPSSCSVDTQEFLAHPKPLDPTRRCPHPRTKDPGRKCHGPLQGLSISQQASAAFKTRGPVTGKCLNPKNVVWKVSQGLVPTELKSFTGRGDHLARLFQMYVRLWGEVF